MRRRIIDDGKLKELLRQGKTLMEMGKELGVSHVAVHKRIKKIGLLELPKSLESLTAKEQKFAIAVAGGKSRISAVMETYDVTSRESAKALQNTLMKNPEIRIAIDDLMEVKGIGREFRIEKLGEHMKSHDPVVSLKALDMGFKLSGDEGESKRNATLEKHAIDIDIDMTPYRNFSYEKVEGKCIVCEKEGDNGFCKSCCEKYPEIVDKAKKYWAGDECAICSDAKRCYDYCKACKEAKGSNHV